jgi:predicted phage terminase large subunit-like protein
MLSMPPRHGKSFIASERFPAWHLGHHPDHEIIACSYASDLAQQSSRRALALTSSEYFSAVFPKYRAGKSGVEKWETSLSGGYRPAGIGQGITGQGAHILIVDDPIKDWTEALSETRRNSVWDWFGSTAYTRLAPGGGVLIIQTRWHQDDLSGRLLEQQKRGEGDTWDLLTFPAIAEEQEQFREKGEPLHFDRYPLPALLQIKGVIGSKAWNSLYQQKPSATEGEIIKRSWFRLLDAMPTQFESEIISVDATFKEAKDNDYVSIQHWGKIGPNYYITDTIKKRMGFGNTCSAIKTMKAQHPNTTIIIEDKANGSAIVETLRREISGVVAVNPQGGKEARAMAITGVIEGGNVFVPRFAAWLEDFLSECAAFPSGAHDDQIDSMSQALLKFQSVVNTEWHRIRI